MYLASVFNVINLYSGIALCRRVTTFGHVQIKVKRFGVVKSLLAGQVTFECVAAGASDVCSNARRDPDSAASLDAVRERVTPRP